MTHRRFFCDRIEEGADGIVLTGAEARHAASALRLQPGDEIELRDGRGAAWEGIISGVKGAAVHVRLTGKRELGSESSLDLTLALAYARSERMELALRQATELGVARIAVFRAERSQYGLAGEKAGKREERWRKIVQAALCQCGRARTPELVFLSCVDDLLAGPQEWQTGARSGGLGILALESEKEESLLSLWQKFPSQRKVLMAVGPEGGWTQGEMERFMSADFHKIHLGPRVLRLETAAAAVVAAAQLLWGDLGGPLKDVMTP